MRNLALSMAALLVSSAAFASNGSCQAEQGHSARLACYDQMATAINACQEKTDKLDRLECYDNVSQVVRTALGSPKTKSQAAVVAAAPVTAAPAPQIDPVASFGNENKAVAEQKQQLDQISATVAKVKKDPYGKWTITLDNDQRWKQTESGNFKLKNGDTVVIERAAFGSFLLSKEGSNKRVRVKRL